jgi:hypothetical protein
MNTWNRLQLVKKYLSNLQNIPDMALYAETWRLLSIEFLILGAISNALYCQSRAEYYAELAGGEWLRLIEQPVAELIQVAQ